MLVRANYKFECHKIFLANALQLIRSSSHWYAGCYANCYAGCYAIVMQQKGGSPMHACITNLPLAGLWDAEHGGGDP